MALSGTIIFFAYYLINGNIFGKMFLNTKCVFWVHIHPCQKIVLTQGTNQRVIITKVYRFACKVPVILVRFQRDLNFPHRFSEKSQISYFIKNPFIGSRVAPYWRTDDQNHDDANSTLLTILRTRLKPAPSSPLFEATSNQFNVFTLVLYRYKGRAGECWETSHNAMLSVTSTWRVSLPCALLLLLFNNSPYL